MFLRHPGQLAERRGRGFTGCLQQVLVKFQPAKGRRLRENGGIVLQFQPVSFPGWRDFQHEIKFRPAIMHGGHGGSHSRNVEINPTGILKHKHMLHQRRAAEIANQAHGIDQIFKRKFLVSERFHHCLMGRTQRFRERLPTVRGRTQHHRVDETSDHILHRRMRPTSHRRGNEKFRLPAQPVQQRLERSHHHHKRCGLRLPRLCLNAAPDSGIQAALDHRTLVGANQRMRSIHRQMENPWSRAQFLQPKRQIPCEITMLQPAVRPCGETRARRLQGRPQRLTLVFERIVGQGQILIENRHRPTVGNNMMKRHHQPVLLIAQLHEQRAHQRTL